MKGPGWLSVKRAAHDPPGGLRPVAALTYTPANLNSAHPSPRAPSRLPALRHRDFRWLLVGAASSSIALWTLLLGNAWIVFRLSDSSVWVGVATFASMFPFLLSPFGGVVADRLERRRLLIISRVVSLIAILTLFVLAVTDVIAVWMVVAMALVQGLIRSAEMPGEQAHLANVVPPDDLANAVTLSTTSRLGSRAVGPLLATPLLDTLGVEGAYGIAAVFAFLALLAVLRVQTRSWGGVADLSNVLFSLGEGVRYVLATGPVRAIFLIVVAHCTMTMSFDAMLPAFADHHLHDPTTGFTMLMVGVGAGAFFGTLSLALFPGGKRGTFFLATALLSGASPAFMALSTTVPMATSAAVVMGASQAMFMALSAVFLQEVIQEAVRGRVMSLYLMSAGGLMAFANLGFGSVADWLGVPVLLLVPGLVFVAVTLATAWVVPTLRRVYGTGTIAQPAPANPA